ncbi:MAG: 6-phosphogluconolactonase [Chloroflexi bacterium]|nr:6-phosphogluconolactonase [Chloroflexota bacterium]
MYSLEIYHDAISLATNAVRHIIAIANQAIKADGKFSIALAGGSTPRGIYRLLAGDDYKGQMDWERVHIFWGDERTVPPSHTESNYLLASQTLLDHILISSNNIHRIKGELKPETAAETYERELAHFFRPSKGAFPKFDLVLLGLGEDGHTASLFPDTTALNEGNRWVVANHVEKLDSWRITFTPGLINTSSNIIFLVSGEIKSEILHFVLEGDFRPNLLPAQLIKPLQGKLLWLVDQAATSKMKTK